MVKSHLYAASPPILRERYEAIVTECRLQGIGEITILASITGKLTASPPELRQWKQRLESDGLKVSAMILAVGHPYMEEMYKPDGSLKAPPWYEGELLAEEGAKALNLLPRGWQYAVNEFGQNVYASACPNAAWREGNVRIIREVAAVFDEVWYDDEYRIDSDQLGGENLRSTASCYCETCLESLGRQLGRKLTREHIIADQRLHEAWVEQKVRLLLAGWKTFCQAGREVNPQLALGLMVRWGGEERDGLDVPALAKEMGDKVLLRLGEGHFGAEEYAEPASQVVEYLASTYHVSWFPRTATVRSETTYFAPMPRQGIFKKAALAIAAGAGQLSYCPCVPAWVEYQRFIAEDRKPLERWADAIEDKAAMWGEIQIVRGKAAAYGDRSPVQRRRDRQPFGLFGMAGLGSAVVRVGCWRHDRKAAVVAVTGRAVWDYPPAEWARHKLVVLDGAALLERSSVNAALGIGEVRKMTGGQVEFESVSNRMSGGGSEKGLPIPSDSSTQWMSDGKLWRKDNLVIVPVVWQDIPEVEMEGWLREVRRVISPQVEGLAVDGDVNVLPVHYRLADRDVVLVVNLTKSPRKVRLRPPTDRIRMTNPDGRKIGLEWELDPDEIRVVQLS